MNTRDFMKAIERVIDPLKRRVTLMVGRCVVTAIDDSKMVQLIKCDLLSDETHDEVERFQHYGFTSHPIAGCEGIAVFPGGNRESGVIIATEDRRYRLTNLGEGEVALYDDLGQEIVLTREGIKITTEEDVDVSCAVANVVAEEVNLGDGTLEAILNGETFQTTFNAHTHSVAGITSTPPLSPSLPTDLSTVVKGAK